MQYSYAAVVVVSLVGLLLPQAAGLVLGPTLVVGLLVLGVAHGACDQLVLPVRYPHRAGVAWGRYLLGFGAGYLGLAGLVLLGWWQWPGLMVGLFFLLTVWHWGSADAPALVHQCATWLSHSLLRGLLLFAVPALGRSAETYAIVRSLLEFTGAAPLPESVFTQAAGVLGLVAGGGHLLLWGSYARRRAHQHWQTDLMEVGLLMGLLLALPPMLSVGVYFVFWHSLQHVLRLNQLFTPSLEPELPAAWAWGRLGQEIVRFSRRAWPLLLLSVVGLLGLYQVLAPRLPNGAALFSFGLVVASVVTLPHALVVSLLLDAERWWPTTRKPISGLAAEVLPPMEA